MIKTCSSEPAEHWDSYLITPRRKALGLSPITLSFTQLCVCHPDSKPTECRKPQGRGQELQIADC